MPAASYTKLQETQRYYDNFCGRCCGLHVKYLARNAPCERGRMGTADTKTLDPGYVMILEYGGCHHSAIYNPVVYCRVGLLGDSEVVAVSPASTVQCNGCCRSVYWQYLFTSSSQCPRKFLFFEYSSNAEEFLFICMALVFSKTLNHLSRASFHFP